MPYAVAPIPFKPHRLNGLSVRLLESHYENNYGGAVRRLNAIEARLAALDWAAAPVFEINGLKREQLIAAGSMILHEVYFDALGGAGGDPGDADLTNALESSFGSLDNWRREFIAMGKALGGGSGWVLLSWSHRLGRLLNQWAADHAHGLPDSTPILALDMYEHAYHLDFGARAAAYVDAFMANLSWGGAVHRFKRAWQQRTHPVERQQDERAIGVAQLRDALSRHTAPLVLDVRLADDRERSGQRLPNTAWRNWQEDKNWMAGLPKDRQIVVYCMYGFWVSQDAAAALRKEGFDARNLAGGIAAWRAMGYPTEAAEDS